MRLDRHVLERVLDEAGEMIDNAAGAVVGEEQTDLFCEAFNLEPEVFRAMRAAATSTRPLVEQLGALVGVDGELISTTYLLQLGIRLGFRAAELERKS